jgi:hypothetical protein
MKSLTMILIFMLSINGTYAGGSHSSGSHSTHVSASSPGTHTTQGHVTRNGTYVPTHTSTNPNHTTSDNYSAKGNINPNTGKEGTKTSNTSRATSTGPNGGHYYINDRGKKVYVK